MPDIMWRVHQGSGVRVVVPQAARVLFLAGRHSPAMRRISPSLRLVGAEPLLPPLMSAEPLWLTSALFLRRCSAYAKLGERFGNPHFKVISSHDY